MPNHNAKRVVADRFCACVVRAFHTNELIYLNSEQIEQDDAQRARLMSSYASCCVFFFKGAPSSSGSALNCVRFRVEPLALSTGRVRNPRF